MLDQLLLAFGTLFAIVNPFSTSLVFLKLTHGWSNKDRYRVALQASFAAFITLTVFLFSGQAILSFFGVTVYAFRVAGGLYLLWIGFEMLSPHLRKQPDNYDSTKSSIAIIPLAIPLLSGPGSLTSVLVLGSELSTVIVLASIFAVCLVSWLVLRESAYLQNILGKKGTLVLERLMGIIVLVVAVQFIFNGITEYIFTLP